MMDIELLDQLETEHREVESLLERLQKAQDAETQASLVEQLVTAQLAHMELEESEVYPQLADLDDEAVAEALTEHGLAREGVTKLQELIGEPGFGAAVEMVRAGIAHHVEEEENEAFPLLRASARRDGNESVAEGASKADLYEAAKRAGIEGRSTMTKDELAHALDEE
jgi:hemerythrin-like domain-containing protein